MKVKYEFDLDDMDKNDKYELELIQRAHAMHSALSDIREYIRQLNKGWMEDDKGQILDSISDYIEESRIYEIE